MSSQQTAILPQDRIPTFQKIIYGLGSLANNMLAAALGCMVIVLNLGLGMDPGKIGMILACSKFTDALLDPVMGYVSDHTRSRWGRRRPFIVVGALISGLVFALMWQLPARHSQNFYFWFFLIGTNLFYIAYTIYAAPFIGLGYELTADYHERTRLQGVSNFIGQIAWMAVPWFYAIMENKHLFRNNVEGARGLAIVVGIFVAVVGILPGIFCREPFYSIAQTEEKKEQKSTSEFLGGLLKHVAGFFKGFGITLLNRRFLVLSLATFCIFNGFQMIAGLGPYNIIYYVFGGDQQMGSQYIGWFGSFISVATFCVIFFITWLASRVGKKMAFIISTIIAIFGYALKWFCYKPGAPLLLFIPAPFIAFGLGGLFTTVGAMIADVCDQDELENGHRREGTFGAIFWWMVKLGMALALAISGHLLNWTGFLQELGGRQSPHTLFLMRAYEIGLPILAYVLAIIAVSSYDLTQEKAHQIRIELEKRRGTAG
jgi:GPH family glycoside/pentoside/hexuronide:cation symporter